MGPSEVTIKTCDKNCHPYVFVETPNSSAVTGSARRRRPPWPPKGTKANPKADQNASRNNNKAWVKWKYFTKPGKDSNGGGNNTKMLQSTIGMIGYFWQFFSIQSFGKDAICRWYFIQWSTANHWQPPRENLRELRMPHANTHANTINHQKGKVDRCNPSTSGCPFHLESSWHLHTSISSPNPTKWQSPRRWLSLYAFVSVPRSKRCLASLPSRRRVAWCLDSGSRAPHEHDEPVVLQQRPTTTQQRDTYPWFHDQGTRIWHSYASNTRRLSRFVSLCLVVLYYGLSMFIMVLQLCFNIFWHEPHLSHQSLRFRRCHSAKGKPVPKTTMLARTKPNLKLGLAALGFPTMSPVLTYLNMWMQTVHFWAFVPHRWKDWEDSTETFHLFYFLSMAFNLLLRDFPSGQLEFG